MILVLGLSRTGTRTLHKAFGLLGIASIHYPLDWIKMQGNDGLLNWEALEQAQVGAVSDIVLLPFISQILERYPDSTLIFSVREKESWLRSLRTHKAAWERGVGYACDKAQWLRKAVYGTVDFDEQQYAIAYDAWSQKKELLGQRYNVHSINVCAGDGWEKLCSMVNRDIPNVPFPHESDV